jgi:protein SCO1/2
METPVVTSEPVSTISIRWVNRTARFLSGGSFPAFAICTLFFYQIFVAFMALSPAGGGALGDFIDDFRLRCFRFSNGVLEMTSVWVMVSEPIPLQLFFLFLWRQPLRDLWLKKRRALLPLTSLSMLLVLAIAGSLLGIGRNQAAKPELPFPADRLRSALPMPAFTMANQEGESISLQDLQGRVVLLTGIYASCTTTCPMMLTRIRKVLDELSEAERLQLTVVAFTLNPEVDSRELRKMISRIYNMDSPQFHFVNGVPSEVNAVLDRLDVSRTRDEASGQIMHSNLFFLLDRSGKIAYRLSLSNTEQSWLPQALRILIAEKE